MPSYISKIKSSIKEINKSNGEKNKPVSYQAILKHIEAKFPTEGTKYKAYVKRALKKAIEAHTVVQIKRSFRLPQKRVVSNKKSVEKVSPAPSKRIAVTGALEVKPVGSKKRAVNKVTKRAPKEKVESNS